MLTLREFAELALAQPEAVQASHFGKPDFRVRNKIFAGLDSAAGRAWLKVRREIQQVLTEARPQTFVPASGAWGESGWTYVVLECADLDEVRPLVADAWRQVAPTALAARHAQAPSPELELAVTETSGAERGAARKKKPRAKKKPAPSTRSAGRGASRSSTAKPRATKRAKATTKATAKPKR